MENKFYAGIGSRETPNDILSLMEKIGFYLGEYGAILNSGGADGADKSFENGCDKANGKKYIYLPWKGFNDNESDLYIFKGETEDIAKHYHPNWNDLKHGARCMMIRNVCQVLGYDLQTPVKFIVCWTKDGKASGGTGQALRIAQDKNIKIYNLKNENDLNFWKNKIYGSDVDS